MLGCSIFLGEDLSEATYQYMKRMKAANFTGIFTSLHIPEDDASQYLKRIQALGKAAMDLELSLMVDISAKALEAIGVKIESNVSKLQEMGITGIRMDYGIDMTTIAAVSRVMTVGLNASTLTTDEVVELKQYGADFSRMELWHNYYPRPETGLDKASFISRNQWLKGQGFKVIAFVPGDERLRGPLFDHLPTLEKHRDTHPLAACLELLKDCHVDEVYIGDERLSEKVMGQFTRYVEEDVMALQILPLTNSYQELFIGSHTNRVDSARDVIRSQEARFKVIPVIAQEGCHLREQGSVTLDNQLYGRYMGELQLTKRDLPADSRVNVVAKVVPTDVALIDWIQPGQKYALYQ
ncbi:DUF871 domain-containing protein [Vagococcus sp. BWB3-3]|uniref:DUF871 domain-containing protein n=1 Tax=Vagococcus allomyrinae TaxID=2794353 RepID=A0A940ST19_9ENTE|nr:MupG family TIM beta-alpha barrel fold protein [Vagococcus allomyrinae]MBP1042627.1 DUF871 domain-containing protein [Vagococcus allomyrinae]